MGTKSRRLVDDWLTDDGLTLLECWARDGVYMNEIAARMEVSPATLSKWRTEYPEINKALKTGKELVDYKVENALLKAALGFNTKEIKVTIGKQVKNGQVFEITKETTTREVAPNVTACLAWLNNRKPEQWRRNRDTFFNEDDNDSDLKVTIIRGSKEEENDNVNREIKIEKKKASSDSYDAQEGNNDKDYWPDDWEEE